MSTSLRVLLRNAVISLLANDPNVQGLGITKVKRFRLHEDQRDFEGGLILVNTDIPQPELGFGAPCYIISTGIYVLAYGAEAGVDDFLDNADEVIFNILRNWQMDPSILATQSTLDVQTISLKPVMEAVFEELGYVAGSLYKFDAYVQADNTWR